MKMSYLKNINTSIIKITNLITNNYALKTETKCFMF